MATIADWNLPQHRPEPPVSPDFSFLTLINVLVAWVVGVSLLLVLVVIATAFNNYNKGQKKPTGCWPTSDEILASARATAVSYTFFFIAAGTPLCAFGHSPWWATLIILTVVSFVISCTGLFICGLRYWDRERRHSTISLQDETTPNLPSYEEAGLLSDTDIPLDASQTGSLKKPDQQATLA